MVLKDYHCSEHGYFEGWQEACPIKGCAGEVSVVFLQPVSIKSDRTKKADATLKGLAQDFGMTDIKSTREGEHQSGYITRNNSQTVKEREEELAAAAERQPRPGDAAIWGGAGGMSMKSVINGQFKSVRDEAVSVLPSSVGNLTGPRTASYVADHENLQVKP
jgi:hypothetical protein